MLGRALGWPKFGARNLMGTYFHLVPCTPRDRSADVFIVTWVMRENRPREPVAKLDVVSRATLKLVHPVFWDRAGVLEGKVWPDSQVRVARIGDRQGKV